MLLPLPTDYARDESLRCHMALVGCGTREGGRDALNEMTRVTYLSFFLWQAGYGHADAATFSDAEAVLDAAVIRALDTHVWRLDEKEAAVIETILRIHDALLDVVPTHVYVAAQSRLATLLDRTQTISPIRREANTL
ncbi:hypothetical protein [Pararobbsia silviterrae]|uniref:Fis family transcriptional regulator n=1 Tax=Pararobbsia silviterrae TaxID=1792498 RepID=A0A494X242_9BURK|nr:hypothetical protein [Pararobbsia silviterrae]RKP44422.1 hypothetical protein D7S86_27500 [Pararobbsia silviterrae]